jgi:DNA uptake protein ComE-like DNA-binding protein/Tfp pilus assembly protein PilX
MPALNSSHRRLPIARRNRRALVLVLVLIVVMMVALAGFTFAELMLTENKATRLHGEQLRLQQALHSGLEQLKHFVGQPRAMQEAAGGSLDNPKLFQSVSLEPELQDNRTTVQRLRFSVVSPAIDSTSTKAGPAIRFGVENESGRLHLADVLRYEQESPGGGRNALMKLPGMTEAVAEAILDWLDADAQPRPLGAENDYYEGLAEPYSPRNGLPDCLEELLLIKGVTREMLFGADANYNRMLEPHESLPTASSTPQTSLGPTVPWSWHLTLYSAEHNRNAEGQPRINLNGANLTELHQKLITALGPELASFIVAYRQYGPAPAASGSSPGVAPFDPTLPPLFSFRSVLDLAGASVAVSAGKSGGTATVYQSPLSGDASSFEGIAKLMDATAIGDAPLRRGLVSVNDAPALVLQTVPGLDESLAQQIVSARENASATNSNSRRHATWLLTEGIVDLETMKRLLPYLSGGGDVVRAQIVAHFEQPGLAARAEVVVDGTGETAREVLWRDLRFYGAGYPTEWLTAGAPRGARN